MTANDFTKTMQDMMSAFPMDTKALQDAFKSQAALGEKMSKVVLEAAEKSAEVSNKWTKETLSKIGDVSTVKEEPAQYAEAASTFATTSAEMAAEHMSAFAEIAKRVQMDTVELMLAAGKDMSAEATAAMQKAASEVTQAAQKATGEATKTVRKAAAK